MRKILLCAVLALGFNTANAGVIGEVGYGFYYHQLDPRGDIVDQGTLQSVFAKLGYMFGEYGVEINYNTTIGNSDTKIKYGGRYDTNNSFWGADIRFGGNIAGIIGGNHEGLAYFGFGYRDYKYSIDTAGSSLTAFKRQFIYLPVGFYGHEYLDLDWLYARYGLEGRWVFYGWDKAGILKDTYSNAFGAKALLGIDYKIGGVVDIFAQLFVDWWMVPTTKQINARTNSIQAGVEIGFGF